MNNNIPIGFIPVDKAVELIRSDDKNKPVVDIDYLITRVYRIELGGTFRIPRVRALAQNEIYRSRNGKIIYEEHIGNEYVRLDTPLEVEMLKQAIRDKYREEAGHEYKEVLVRGVSTVADDAGGNNAVKPRKNKPNTKVGDSIGVGSVSSSNGEGLRV